MTLTYIILIGRSVIPLKTATKDKRGSKDIHFETSNKFAPLLTENTVDLQMQMQINKYKIC